MIEGEFGYRNKIEQFVAFWVILCRLFDISDYTIYKTVGRIYLGLADDLIGKEND